MPNKEQYDLDFRPKTYWLFPDMKQRILATVKGDERRSHAIRSLDDRNAFHFDPTDFQESLSEEEKTARGRIHPSLMGGEYLPSLQQGEVEIARVSMKSVMRDVISVRARWKNGKIRYAVVNEYETQYIFSFECSDVPLTFGELITLMDSVTEGEEYRYWLSGGLVLSQFEYNYDIGVELESLRGFVRASSAFYPSLSGWYEEACEEWLQGKATERMGAENED